VGNLQTLRLPNAVTNTWAYNALNRLTNLTVTAASGTLASFAYKLAPAGNRTNLSETISGSSRTFAWQYDPLYRLTNEVLAGASPLGTNSYKYDAVGNRTNRTSVGFGLTNQTFAYTGNDRLTTDSYDANGNTTNSAGNTYRYDPENRLTNAIVGGTSIIYVYDGDGNRVRKIVGTTTNSYLVDTHNLTGYAQVLEESVNGALSKVYAYGLDLIAQRDVGGSTYYFGQDGLGSTRLLTTTNATVANVFAYDAFGTMIASNAAPQTEYLFTGEHRDANLGFYYLRARYLNPGTGRFWSRDTYAGSIFDPPSLHRYVYVANNPANMVDPSGNFTIGESIRVLAVVTVIALVVTVGIKFNSYRAAVRSIPLPQVNAEIVRVQKVIERLNEIAADGTVTFASKKLVVGGNMGIALPLGTPGQESRNLYESLWNVSGYSSALSELGGDIRGAQGTGELITYDPDTLPDEQRAVVAGEIVKRQLDYLKWLRRRQEESR
jgi:RHS repeat-associated protein